MLDSLEFEPLLVKPNNHELGDIFGVKLESLDEIEKYARQILDKGAQHVIISMAGDGALLVTQKVHTLQNLSRGVSKILSELAILWSLDLQANLSNQKTQ